MGLLDKALEVEKKRKNIKPSSKNKESQKKKKSDSKISKKSKINKLDSGLKLEQKKPKKLSKTKVVSELKPRVSLSSGKFHLPKPEKKEHDFSKLKKKVNKTIQKKSNKINFAKVKKQIEEKLEDKSSTKLVPHERVATGVPGLDEVIEGGLVKDSSVLVGGGAGSGKTIFCMQFLINGIDQYNEPGIFISFEQSPEEIISDFQRFNWGIEKKIKQKKLALLHFSPEEVNKFLESGGGIVRDTIESIDAKRIVLDSLTAFTLLFKTDLGTRKAVLQLFESMAKWGVTTLLTSEQEPDPEKHSSTIMEFEVDGVILLYNLRKGDVRERSIEIFKMRSTQHSAKIFPMKIEESGITIFPEETIF